jgi:hypothetical protein
MINARILAPETVKTKPIVKGPIRCHKCQLLCQTAADYLNHTCEPRPTQG